MRKVLLLFFCLLQASISFSSEWYRDYENGKEKAEKNQCDEAEKLLLSALEKNPKAELRARPYGTMNMEYFPQYFLARCSFQKGDLAKTKKYLTEAQEAGIEASSSREEYRVLKNRLAAKHMEAQAQTQTNTSQ